MRGLTAMAAGLSLLALTSSSSTSTAQGNAPGDGCKTIVRPDGTRERDCRAKSPSKATAVPHHGVLKATTPGAVARPTEIHMLFGSQEQWPQNGGRITAIFADQLSLSGTVERPRFPRNRTFDYSPSIYIFADRLQVEGTAKLDFAGKPMARRKTTKTFRSSDKVLSQHRFSCRINDLSCRNRQADRFCARQGYEVASKLSFRITGSRVRSFRYVTCMRNSDSRFAHRGYGSSLTLFVRKIECGSGRLTIDTSGGMDGARPAGNAGRVTLVVGNAAQARKCVTIHSRGRPSRKAVWRSSPADFLAAAKSRDGTLYGQWLLALVDYSVSRMNEASITGDKRMMSAAAQLGQTYLSRDRYPVPADLSSRWKSSAKAFRKARDELLPRLWTEELSLDGAMGPGHNATLVFLADEAGAWIAPDRLLVRRFEANGKPILGRLAFDPQRPDRLKLEGITAELIVDPRATAVATRKLLGQGQAVRGQFSDWIFGVEAPPMSGVRAFIADGDGRELHISVEVDTGVAGQEALQRLATIGIPLYLNWLSNRFPDIGGKLGPLILSLGHQTQTDLKLGNGQVANSGSSEQKLDFVQVAPGRFVELNPAISVGPGQKVAFQGSSGRIVPTGVTHLIGAQEIPKLFGQVNAEGLLQSVQIVNLVGADPDLGPLEYVELTLNFDGGNGIQKSQPVRVASRGTFGSEKLLTFFAGPSTPRISAKGVAVFEDGSSQTFAIDSTSNLILRITRASIGLEKP